MCTRDEAVAGYGRLPGLLAYLSLSMVTAAWGAMIGPEWCQWWAVFGAVGFVSAIGLDIRERARLRALLDELEEHSSPRLEEKLDRTIRHIQSADALRRAVERIARTSDAGMSRPLGRRREPRMPLDVPVTVTRVGDAEEDSEASSRCWARDIFLNGIGLIHDRRLERGSVILEFELDDGEPLRFLADLLWCERQDDGQYFSGGKLLELIDADGGAGEPA